MEQEQKSHIFCATSCPISPELSKALQQLASVATKLEGIAEQMGNDKEERKRLWAKIDELETSADKAQGSANVFKVVGGVLLAFLIPILGWCFVSLTGFQNYIVKDEQRTIEFANIIADMKKTDEKILSLLGDRK